MCHLYEFWASFWYNCDMKILSITAQKPHSTGSGTYLTELVKAFDEAGCKQAVVAGIYPDDQVSFPAGVDFYPVYFDADSNSKAAVGFPVVGMSDSMPYPSTKYSEMSEAMVNEFEEAFLEVAGEAIDLLEPDVILCHHLFLLTAMIRKHFPDKKVYGICHGTDLRQMVNCPHLAEKIKPQIQKLDHIFALHEEQKNQIEKIFDIKNKTSISKLDNRISNTDFEKIDNRISNADCEIFNNNFSNINCVNHAMVSVIGSGYNAKLFNADGRGAHGAGELCRVCFAGKVSEAKGAPELLDAIDKLNTEIGQKFELLIAGGCQEEKLKARLERLPENVTYLGMLPQTELAKVFKSCDIFILPSYYEGLGLVLIEAMASSLIPICTDLPGIRDWVNENVINPNVRYIPMPEMAGVDTPTEAGREKFTEDIKSVLSDTINFINNSKIANEELPLPDTSKITWREVSKKILNL